MITRKRSPEEILDELEDEDLADEAERVAALSGPEVDRELERQGVDSSALRAGAAAVFERAMGKRAGSLAKTSGGATRADRSSGPAVAVGREARHASSAVLPAARRRAPWRRPAVWSAAAAAAAAAAIGIVAATHAPGLVGSVSTGDWSGVDAAPARRLVGDRERAEVLRGEATTACGLTRWTTCANKLDEAQKLDPAGEGAPSVKKLRQALDSLRARAPRGANGGE